MLTVDYDRLGVGRGDRLLDLGCGGGRHAFEAERRGARVVALDRDGKEMGAAAALLTTGSALVGDGLSLPFPDGVFDRVIAAEVLEHIPDDIGAVYELARVLRPGGTMAISVPRWFPERVCWALADDYHAPLVEGGHVRIYREHQLLARLRAAGLRFTWSHHAHALHAPYWWLKCAVGVRRDDAVLPRLYHRFLVWDLMKRPTVTRLLERALNPLLGKSLVVYSEKPAARGAIDVAA